MLEILAVWWLTRRIGQIVRRKGRKSVWYQVLTIVLWCVGELSGALLGWILTDAGESGQCLIYILALAGAGTGAAIAYWIANSLTPATLPEAHTPSGEQLQEGKPEAMAGQASGRVYPQAKARRSVPGWLWALVGAAAALSLGLLVVGVVALVGKDGRSEPVGARATTVPKAAASPSATPTSTREPTATPTEPPPTVSAPANASAGDTWTRPRDGMVMVYVPAGEFLMGSSENVGSADEHPQHVVFLDAFWMDQTEVTNHQYQHCVAAGHCAEPGFREDDRFQAPNQPVIGVRWEHAVAYCEWAGARLPTEAQWEKAARGTDGRAYPWGNTFDASRLNFCDRNCLYKEEHDKYILKLDEEDDGYAQTAPVGSFPAGASPYGALDMAGNVDEWVADWYAKDYYSRSPGHNPQGPDPADSRVLRGGAWYNSGIDETRSANRNGHTNEVWRYSYDIGFRCCVPVPSSS
jgi:formylglycine-generating enzyme required for sulfatase activity